MWMYYKPYKRDVFVAKVDLPDFDEEGNLEADVFFWNVKENQWNVGCISEFTPPKEQH